MDNDPSKPDLRAACPLPSDGGGRIVMAHGGGGRLTQRLIETVFGPAFSNPALDERHDGARLPALDGRLAMTTDSYVVRPLFFPGGSIGHLAVYGTVNDLAMCGAEPRYLSAGFILEEGLELDVLRRVVADMRAAAEACGVRIVTGDTKVVERGKGDGVFINTAGVGVIRHEVAPSRIAPGDAIVLSGDLGAHGIAIVAARDGLDLQTPVVSDAAPLWDDVRRLIEAGLDIHCLRDLTRGGFATALNELAQARGVQMQIEETAIPVQPAVRGACELLGFDPLYIANEGRFCAFVAERDLAPTLALLPGAVCAGRVGDQGPPQVVLRTSIGGKRVLDLLSGEQLPRIC